MKVLVTGVTGQLGCDVVKELERRGHTAIGISHSQMDITNEKSVMDAINQALPDAVIHCAAYTAVDAAEDNVDICRAVNAKGTAYVARCCGQIGIKLLYISTDYVFNGRGDRPWKINDQRDPLNVYGQTKYEGELAVEKYANHFFIVRVSWMFGANGKNFVQTMLSLGKAHNRVTVVDDQVGSPTYTVDLARLLVDLIETEKYGCYHATNEGYCSWYEFACEIFRQTCIDVQIMPVDSSAYPAKAKRPSNSRMDKKKLTENGFQRLPTWQNALARYLREIEEIQ